MNINERRPWLEPDEPVPVGDALDRWMAAEESARQASTTPTPPPKPRPRPKRRRKADPNAFPAPTEWPKVTTTLGHKCCAICWHIFDDDEFVYLGTVCGNCLDYGLATFAANPSAESALQVAERCLLGHGRCR